MARILVVEDERALERIITLNLVRRGHTVAEADSVASATEILNASEADFDVIILDINLPDQSGWDVLRSLQLRASHAGAEKHQPQVIVATAVRPAQSRIDMFAPSAVLLKPFPIDALLHLIERLLEQSSETTTTDSLGARSDSEQWSS